MRTARSLWASAGIILLLGGIVGTASGAPSPQAALEELHGKTVQALVDHARWCTKRRIFGKRDETYEVVLRFDPDHPRAREKLRYTRDATGAWVQHRLYKPGTNWSPKSIAKHEQQLAGILAAHRTARLAIYGSAAKARDLRWSRDALRALEQEDPEEKRARPLLREILLRYYHMVSKRAAVADVRQTGGQLRHLFPDDVEIRRVLGDEKRGTRWLRGETARSLATHERLAQAVHEALRDGGKPQRAERPAVLKKIKLPWSHGVDAGSVAAHGTAQAGALAALAMGCRAAGPVFRAAMGREPGLREELHIYAFAKKGQIDTFLKGYPVGGQPGGGQKASFGLDVVFVDGETIALSAHPPATQVDLLIRTLLTDMFTGALLDGAPLKGWHAEGVCRYLASRLSSAPQIVSLVGRLVGPEEDPVSKDDWLARAQGLLRRKEKVGLAPMLAKGIDTYAEYDAIVSYAFSIYLMEGHPDKAAAFIQALHKQGDLGKVCREILGFRLAIMEYRFREWLDEITAISEAPAGEQDR